MISYHADDYGRLHGSGADFQTYAEISEIWGNQTFRGFVELVEGQS